MTNLDPQYEAMIKQSVQHAKDSIHSLCEEVRRLEGIVADAAIAINPCAHEGEDLLTIVRSAMSDYKALIMTHDNLVRVHKGLLDELDKPKDPPKIEVFSREECIYNYCYDPKMCEVKCKAPRGA